jgi:hypothetical protein
MPSFFLIIGGRLLTFSTGIAASAQKNFGRIDDLTSGESGSMTASSANRGSPV